MAKRHFRQTDDLMTRDKRFRELKTPLQRWALTYLYVTPSNRDGLVHESMDEMADKAKALYDAKVKRNLSRVTEKQLKDMDPKIAVIVREAKAALDAARPPKPPKKKVKWSEEAKACNRERIACRKAGLFAMGELRQHLRNDAGLRRILLYELVEDYREEMVSAVLRGIEQASYEQQFIDRNEITIGKAFDWCDEDGVRLEDER